MSNMNENEWFAAVFLARHLLELSPYEQFEITLSDLKKGAIELLDGLIARHDGGEPRLSEKTREIISLIQSYASIEIAKNGGGLQ